jgi:hypothetical protein
LPPADVLRRGHIRRRPGTRQSVRQFGLSSARPLRKATQAHVLDQTFAQTASSRGQGLVLRRLLMGRRSRYSQCRSPAPPLNPCASFELRQRHLPKHNPAKRVRSSAPMRPLSPVRVPWLASRMQTTISGDAAPSWSAHHDLGDARSMDDGTLIAVAIQTRWCSEFGPVSARRSRLSRHRSRRAG